MNKASKNFLIAVRRYLSNVMDYDNINFEISEDDRRTVRSGLPQNSEITKRFVDYLTALEFEYINHKNEQKPEKPVERDPMD